jgi:ADP-glucose pyrophosphorylase
MSSEVSLIGKLAPLMIPDTNSHQWAIILAGGEGERLGTDSYDTDLDQRIPYGVGRESFIKNAIIDKNARIGESVRLFNLGGFKDFDGENYYIRDGIGIIPKNAVIEDGTRN